jgi:hypothetical protein
MKMHSGGLACDTSSRMMSMPLLPGIRISRNMISGCHVSIMAGRPLPPSTSATISHFGNDDNACLMF